MPKKKDNKTDESVGKKEEGMVDEESLLAGEDSTIDPAIIEDTFDEFSEYNDVDNF